MKVFLAAGLLALFCVQPSGCNNSDTARFISGCSEGYNNAVQRENNSNNLRSGENGVIESFIDGEFEGFKGETIIKLTNGQIWQQTEYYYHYHYGYRLPVLIYRSASSYKMKVEGIEKAVRVIRLK